MHANSDSIVLILIDGMRPDGLRASPTPVMDGLIEGGCSTFRARSVMPAITLPCITSLFHSSTEATHGIHANKWTPAPTLPPSLFSIVRSKERKTASICNWEELRDISPVGSLDTAIYIDNAHDSGGRGDRLIAELAAETIRRDTFTLTFVYMGHVDTVGHDVGFMSEAYINAISAADASVGVILDALHPHTTTIVLADHGGHGNGHGSDCDEDLTIPVILNGPGIPRNHVINEAVSILDIAPTVAQLLQMDCPAEWQGEPIALPSPEGQE